MDNRPCFIFCGAIGADSLWKVWAERARHRIVECLPTGGGLEQYREETIRVGHSLHRPFPTLIPYTNLLLMRNIKAVSMTKQIYAVGLLKGKEIQGGTAWACQAMINRNDQTDVLYFFDQITGHWYRYSREASGFVPALPFAPIGTWLGIGSRDLTPIGEKAIAEVWERTPEGGRPVGFLEDKKEQMALHPEDWPTS